MPEKNHKLIANYFRIASILGILLLLVLQFLWFKNAYKMVDQEIMEKCKVCLREAIDKELFERIKKMSLKVDFQQRTAFNNSKYNIVGEGSVFESSDVNIVLQDVLYGFGSKASLNRINTIFKQKIQKYFVRLPMFQIQLNNDTISENYKLVNSSHQKINRQDLNKTEIQKKKDDNVSLNNYDIIENHKIKSRINSKKIIVLEIQPNSIIFFDKARFLLLASVLIVLLIGFIMISQLRTVLREHRFVQFIKEYTSSVTHDLQTPMNNISMAMEMLSMGKLDNDDKMRENYYRICKEQSERQISNIGKILILAKSEKEFITLEKQSVKIKDFLEDIIESFKKGILFSKEHILIKMECFPENITANIDSYQIESVMNNLIDNAIKYSYDNISIEINCIEDGNNIIIKVKDQGIGISAQNLETIFKYLERGSQVERKRLIGYGIGLSFVEKIINAHGGSISVKSIEGIGSEFIISLPKG